MKKYLLVLLLLLVPVWGWAVDHAIGTWYVCQSNAGNASGSSVANCRSAAGHNTDTWAAGSTIYLVGAISVSVNPPSSGSDGLPITYRMDLAGNYGVLTQSASTSNFFVNGKSYITLEGGNVGTMAVTYNNAGAANVLVGGTSNHVIVQNIPTLTNTYGHIVSSSGTNTYFTVSNLTGSTTAGYGIISTAAGSTNWTVTGNTFTGSKGMRIDNLTTGTISGNTCTTSSLNCLYMSGSNTVTVSGNTATNITGVGYYDTGSTAITYTSNTVNVSESGFASNNGNGNTYTSNTSIGNTGTVDYLMGGTSHDYIYTGNMSRNGVGDAYAITDTAYNATYYKNTARNMGSSTSESVGDCFTAHLNNYGLVYKYNIADGCTTSGFSMINTSSGVIANNTIVNTGTSSGADRGGIYLGVSGVSSGGGAGATWVVRNNIISNNTPYEVNLTASAAAIVDLDYNLLYPGAKEHTATLDFGATPLTWTEYHTGNSREAHSISADPLFVSTSDFRLRSGSPAINTGADLCATLTTATDYSGRNVCIGGVYVGLVAPEIGAYEFIPNGGIFNFGFTFSF